MMTKRHIARILTEVAFFLRLKGGNPYKAAAYERAARSLLLSPSPIGELTDEERLTEIPGIGPSTAAVIRELLLTGHSSLHERVKGSYPISLAELGHVPGLRPKQILRLYQDAGIRSVSELRAACRNNQLQSVKGIGPKLQAKIERALDEFRRGEGYRLYANAVDEALLLAHSLAAIPGVQRVTIAGAIRRKLEIVNSLHFVIGWPDDQRTAAFIDGLRAIAHVSDAAMSRPGEVTATSPTGLPIIITLAGPTDYEFYLFQATGSREHVEQVLKRFSGKGLATWTAVRRQVSGMSESAIYRAAGLPFVPPTLREGQGELGWSAREVDALIQLDHLHGFFHLHTRYSDGTHTVEEMVRAARDRGYRYLGISDHSQSAFYANGMTEPRIYQQWKEIDAVQANYPDIHIFKGIEADILPDGTMDYADHLLSRFDFVIASIHSRFNLSEPEQTQRVCRALANPYVTMLGHPSGRLLLSRPGYRLNMPLVIETAAAHGKALEINGSRNRLDLDWRYVRPAKKRGVKFSINPDAHATDELDNMALAVTVAQKGGLAAEDVINSQPLDMMKAFLSRRRLRSQAV